MPCKSLQVLECLQLPFLEERCLVYAKIAPRACTRTQGHMLGQEQHLPSLCNISSRSSHHLVQTIIVHIPYMSAHTGTHAYACDVYTYTQTDVNEKTIQKTQKLFKEVATNSISQLY